MAKGELKLRSDGIREMLKSDELKNYCKNQAEIVASKAGTGYGVSTYTGKTRVNASVRAVTNEAYKDNLENNTLMKAVGK